MLLIPCGSEVVTSTGCISMVETDSGKKPETWNDRVRDGRHKLPGGIHEGS